MSSHPYAELDNDRFGNSRFRYWHSGVKLTPYRAWVHCYGDENNNFNLGVSLVIYVFSFTASFVLGGITFCILADFNAPALLLLITLVLSVLLAIVVPPIIALLSAPEYYAISEPDIDFYLNNDEPEQVLEQVNRIYQTGLIDIGKNLRAEKIHCAPQRPPLSSEDNAEKIISAWIGDTKKLNANVKQPIHDQVIANLDALYETTTRPENKPHYKK